jgi:hypothetical protein
MLTNLANNMALGYDDNERRFFKDNTVKNINDDMDMFREIDSVDSDCNLDFDSEDDSSTMNDTNTLFLKKNHTYKITSICL